MANVLKMATVADIVTLMKSGHSERRISAVLSLDRGTVAKYRRQTAVSIYRDAVLQNRVIENLKNFYSSAESNDPEPL